MKFPINRINCLTLTLIVTLIKLIVTVKVRAKNCLYSAHKYGIQ